MGENLGNDCGIFDGSDERQGAATVPTGCHAAAARQAVETPSPDDVICITGSLYVVGEAKEAIQKGLIKSVKTQK